MYCKFKFVHITTPPTRPQLEFNIYMGNAIAQVRNVTHGSLFGEEYHFNLAAHTETVQVISVLFSV